MISELAGVAGVGDPGPLTLAELCIQARAKNQADWNRTSHILAVLLNSNRDPKKSKPVTPMQLNPYISERRRKKAEKPKVFISISTFAKAMTKAKK